jgi:hypothetical protein
MADQETRLTRWRQAGVLDAKSVAARSNSHGRRAMKIGRWTIAGLSVAVLAVLFSTVAAKHLYERWRCPRVWTRAAAVDSELPMRGRYLALQLTVDGCQSTLPSAKLAEFPRDYSGAVKPGPYVLRAQPVVFRANLKAANGRLIAVRPEGVENTEEGEWISAAAGAVCDQMQLKQPVHFFIGKHAPSPLTAGAELWVEVIVPPKGAPRPLQLAVKENGIWKPLKLK